MLINFANIQKSLLPLVERQFPDGLFKVDGLEKEKIVILTIDDGISSRSRELMNLLTEFDAKATFFIHKSNTITINNSQDVLNNILKQGHEIGNHMPEDIPSISLSQQEFEEQFREADLFLRDLGIKPHFFRASGGYFNTEKMMPLLRELDYEQKFIMASFLPWDTHFPFPHIYANQLIDGIFSGAIVVFHDGEQKGDQRLARTFISLRKFLVAMKQKEYQIVSLGKAVHGGENVNK
jgi:peptidoglycan/xylan/chitin deacetylase (PgdA/CDA1 family)